MHEKTLVAFRRILRGAVCHEAKAAVGCKNSVATHILLENPCIAARTQSYPYHLVAEPVQGKLAASMVCERDVEGAAENAKECRL